MRNFCAQDGLYAVLSSQIQMLIASEGLFQYDKLWAAAGMQHAVFKLSPDNLKSIVSWQDCEGKVICFRME